MEKSFDFLTLIQSKDLSFWDVKRLNFSFSSLSKIYSSVKLGDILTPIKNKIKKTEYNGKLPIISKISFNDGKIHLRDDFKTGMDLYSLSFNDLLVSNINFHQGATAINKIGDVVCSTHYQPYHVDFLKVIPEYLILILRSKIFLGYVSQQKVNGIKTESNYNFIKNLKIPLPSLEKQKELVAQYNNLLNLAEAKENQAKIIETSIDGYLIAELGIKDNLLSTNSSLFQTVEYKSLDKWETNKKFILSAKYNVVNLDKNIFLFSSFKRGKSPKYKNISNCYAINQKCVRLDEIDLQYKKAIDEKWNASINDELKTKINDILINSTGEGTIGRAAIVNKGQDNLVYDSHILDLRLNSKYISPLYFIKIFNSHFVQKQINLYKSGTSTKQTELGVENAKKIQFPLPPLDIQNQIVEEVTRRKEQSKNLRIESEKLRLQAISNFEKEIFI